jgi:hypothetical protein
MAAAVRELVLERRTIDSTIEQWQDALDSGC